MSLSKEPQAVAAAAEPPRQPKCTRCRHHGIIVPQKGHVKFCPFLKCDCWKCYLITQRTRITALQRNLKRTHTKPPDRGQRPGASGATPAASDAACGASAPDGGARPSDTAGLTCPSPGEAPELAACGPLDLRSRPAAGGERGAGSDSRKAPPFAPSEEAPCTPCNAPHFGEFGQTAPLPLIHFPFTMSGHYPSSFTPFSNFLLNMPWLPPVPPGLYSDGLCGPLMFPHFQSGSVHCPPLPEPGPPADCRQVFFTLQPPPHPEPFQEDQM